jgi:[ribosomal protein S5]-alanine N-acetyltransferase
MSAASSSPSLLRGFPILGGENVKLRPLYKTDAKRIPKLLTQEVSYYLKLIIPIPYKIKDAMRFIEQSHRSFKSRKGFIFGIDIRESDDYNKLSTSTSSLFVGIISLENIDKTNRNAEVGYWIGKEYWDMGIATESLTLLINYSFNVLDLHKVYASVFAENIASIRVLEKCSLTKEGELYEHRYKNGKFHNMLLYGTIKKK